jgi:glucan phosphoethanolaminetransferase (alkaline phosphatase superfamily)
VLWLYYGLALVSLDAWGNLVSWSLISTYIQQAAYLTDILGSGAYALMAAVMTAMLATTGALYALFRRNDWVAWLAGRHGPVITNVVGLVGIALLAVFWWRFAVDPPTREREPVALTFWPEPFEQKVGHSALATAPGGEDDERAGYTPGAATLVRSTNVILIVSDALRARNMGLYGYGRDTTPFLSRMAREGIARHMLRAQSVCSQSNCGLLGIASGRYVHQLSGSPLTLPQVLQMHGYRTHMVLSGDHTNFYGLRKMYGAVDSYFDGSMSGGYMNDDAQVLQELRRLELGRTQGQFIQVHLMATHLLGHHATPDRFGEARSYHSGLSGVAASQADRRRFINFYDSGVAQADDTIRGLLQVLRARGLLDDALVVVTGDHGELLGEHGLFGHAKAVYGEVIDVPLVFLTFGKAGPLPIDEQRLASQVDIAPTVLAQLGMPIPRRWSGLALQSHPRAAAERDVFFQQDGEYGLVARKSDGRTWKFWVDARSGAEQAYELDADPLETRNRVAELDPGDRKRWRRSLVPLEANVRDRLAAR